jgi:hypothetical protein
VTGGFFEPGPPSPPAVELPVAVLAAGAEVGVLGADEPEPHPASTQPRSAASATPRSALNRGAVCLPPPVRTKGWTVTATRADTRSHRCLGTDNRTFTGVPPPPKTPDPRTHADR